MADVIVHNSALIEWPFCYTFFILFSFKIHSFPWWCRSLLQGYQTWLLVSLMKSGNTVWHLAKNLIKIYKAIEVCDTGYVRAVFISLSCWDCTSVNYIMFQSWVIVPHSSDRTFCAVIVIVESLLPVQRSPTRHRDSEKEGGGGNYFLICSLLMSSCPHLLIIPPSHSWLQFNSHFGWLTAAFTPDIYKLLRKRHYHSGLISLHLI